MKVADVPLGQVLVECGASTEHVVHVSDVRDIPKGDILVKLRGEPAALVAAQHVPHVGDLADVPGVHHAVVTGPALVMALLDGVGDVALVSEPGAGGNGERRDGGRGRGNGIRAGAAFVESAVLRVCEHLRGCESLVEGRGAEEEVPVLVVAVGEPPAG